MPNIHVEEVVRDVYVLRVDDKETRFFEALWEIPEGITYNAYLVLGDEKSVLVDGWKERYSEDFLETLGKLIEPEKLDYIILNHMEPDHTGTLPLLYSAAREATILAHPLAVKMARSFYGINGRIRPVKDMEEVDIGGRKLVFHFTPWLHWPETIMTYLMPERVLFSCDAFGGYSIPQGLYDDEVDWDYYAYYAKKYLFTVIGAYIDHISRNIGKLEKREVTPSIIAPAHGLIFRSSPEKIVSLYSTLASGKPVKRKVTVIYDSMYGFVEDQVYEAISVLKSRGAVLSVHRLVDDFRSSLADFIGEAGDSEAIIIGVSTYEAGVFPLMEYVVGLFTKKIKHPKRILLLSTYGWGGVAARKIAKILEEAGHEVVAIIETRGKMSGDEKESIRKAAGKLIEP